MAALSLAPYVHDPLGFVETQYPWGQGDLEGQLGPRDWQREVLVYIRDWLKNPKTRYEVCQVSVASGHGIGKSALISWLIQWGNCTMVDCRGVLTANTDKQLRTKTWPELTKWYNRLAVREFFRLDGMTFAGKGNEKTWRVDAIPWSESNPDAFAGYHNAGKRLIVFFDEASAIHARIWEVILGAFTDEKTEMLFVVFGNPTRPNGAFFDCFNRLRHRWKNWQIDSRDVEGTNKSYFKKLIEDYGLDSDIVRVRVRGLFPRTAFNQLIGYELVTQGQEADVAPRLSDPLILGVDVARYGDDKSVIYPRKGRVAGLHGGPWRFFGLDNVGLAREIAKLIKEIKPQYVNIDGGGPGGGVIDVLRDWGYDVHEVQFGGAAGNPDYANKRAEMWCDMRDWLRDGGAIPWNDTELATDLTNQTYTYREGKNNSLVLVSKELMKKDGLPSPDSGDALACTFAIPVNPVTDVSRGLGDAHSAQTEYVGGWE